MRVCEKQGILLEGKPTLCLVHMVPMVRSEGTIPYAIGMSTDIRAPKRLEQQNLEAEELATVGQTIAG